MEQVSCDELIQLHRLCLRLIVYGMQDGDLPPAQCQSSVLQGMEMGVDHLGPDLPDDGPEPGHAAQVHPRALAQEPQLHPGLCQVPGQLALGGGQTDGSDAVAQLPQLQAESYAHGFRPAHLEGGHDL